MANHIEAKITDIFANIKRIENLFILEKTRRGINKDSLLFIGMANIAEYYWCAMKALLKSRRNELRFFQVYLEDRLRYSHELGLIDKLPKTDKDLLSI